MFHMLVTRWALRAEVSIKNEFLTHKSSTATFKNHEKGNTMTTCALGCSKNGLLRFFLIMTDSALYQQDKAWLEKMESKVGTKDVYSVGRHNCRAFSQAEFEKAP